MVIISTRRSRRVHLPMVNRSNFQVTGLNFRIATESEEKARCDGRKVRHIVGELHSLSVKGGKRTGGQRQRPGVFTRPTTFPRLRKAKKAEPTREVKLSEGMLASLLFCLAYLKIRVDLDGKVFLHMSGGCSQGWHWM